MGPTPFRLQVHRLDDGTLRIEPEGMRGASGSTRSVRRLIDAATVACDAG
jgi:hypothetical protein